MRASSATGLRQGLVTEQHTSESLTLTHLLVLVVDGPPVTNSSKAALICSSGPTALTPFSYRIQCVGWQLVNPNRDGDIFPTAYHRSALTFASLCRPARFIVWMVFLSNMFMSIANTLNVIPRDYLVREAKKAGGDG